MTQFSAQERVTTITPKPRLKIPHPKVKKWSHQDDLDALKGHKVNIYLNNGREYLGNKLTDADQFTIKIGIPQVDAPTDKLVGIGQKPDLVVTIFKHIIQSYCKA